MSADLKADGLSSWSEIPFVKILLFFIPGIILGIFLPTYPYFWISLSLISLTLYVTFFLYYHRRAGGILKYRYSIFLYIAVFAAIYGYSSQKNFGFKENHFSEYDADYLTVQLEKPLVEKANSYKLETKVLMASTADLQQEVNGNLLIYIEKEEGMRELNRKDKLVIPARYDEISPPMNPEEFNYRRYMSFKGTYHQAYFKSEEWHFLADSPDYWRTQIDEVRALLLDVLRENGITGKDFAVASALILGYKDEIDNDLTRAYASAGAMHVLAVSGLHVGIIFLILHLLLRPLEKVRYGSVFKALIVCVCLWAYAVLTGLSPSVMRAATMFSFIVCADAVQRKSNIYNTLAGSALVLLIYDPFLLMEVGFQLSYTAVLGIVYLQPKIYNLIYVRNKWLDKIWAISAVSIAAQLGTFPIGLLYFHQFPNYFLFSNLIVIPAAMLILYSGLVLFATYWIPFIGMVVSWVLKFILGILNTTVELIHDLPYALTSGISISVLEVWIIYFVLLFLVLYFSYKKLFYLRWFLATLIVLLGVQYYENIQQNRQQQFMVYAVRGESAFDFIKGKENVFVSSDRLYRDKDKMLFHIRHNWDDLNVQTSFFNLHEEVEFKTEVVHRTHSFFLFNGDLIVNLHKSLTRELLSMADLCLISTGCLPDHVGIDNLKGKQVVLDGSLSYWEQQTWMEALEEHEISFHNVLKKGAFIKQY